MNVRDLNYQQFLEVLRNGDQGDLNQFLNYCYDSGLTPHHIYMEIIFPALVEIGETTCLQCGSVQYSKVIDINSELEKTSNQRTHRNARRKAV